MSNLTAGFIDLATYDEIEKYMYAGEDATTYFVRETRRSTWFTQVPVKLSHTSSGGDIGSELTANISRAGDYLLNVWLRVELPKMVSDDGKTTAEWVANVGHRLIKSCELKFNDLVASKLDSFHLDFWNAFTVAEGHRDSYYNHMVAGGKGKRVLNIPLPFFFSRDSGVALPTAALPYNEMTIHLQMEDPKKLVDTAGDFRAEGEFKIAVWANYAIVSNEERTKMACAPRDILIEQFKTAQKKVRESDSSIDMDIRFSHAIKALMFATCHVNADKSADRYKGVPIKNIGLVYENTVRLAREMPIDYYQRVQPFCHAPVTPHEPQHDGIHLYSYSLNMADLDPMGSTNFGKLTNVTISGDLTVAVPQGAQLNMVVVALNNNVIRISGGACGFPVL